MAIGNWFEQYKINGYVAFQAFTLYVRILFLNFSRKDTHFLQLFSLLCSSHIVALLRVKIFCFAHVMFWDYIFQILQPSQLLREKVHFLSGGTFLQSLWELKYFVKNFKISIVKMVKKINCHLSSPWFSSDLKSVLKLHLYHPYRITEHDPCSSEMTMLYN